MEPSPIILSLSDPAFKSLLFKSGENQVRAIGYFNSETPVTLDFRYIGDSSLFKLAQSADALRRLGVQKLNLFCPYFPGARQDRVCAPGDSLTIKVYADFVNSLKFDHVTVFDPHSDVTPALLDRVRVVNNHNFVEAVIEELDLRNYLLVSPDAGANKKVFSLAAKLGFPEVIRADKKRDPSTGSLTGTTVFSDNLNNRDCLIVDDIISGGRTFMNLAEELRKKNAGNIYLAVSHHEGVAQEPELRKSGITEVFTTDSLPLACLSPDSTYTKIVSLKDIYRL